MPRIGVTYWEVANVADALDASGAKVSSAAIREILKTGSLSTITAHLAVWKKRRDERGSPAAMEQTLSTSLNLISRELMTKLEEAAEAKYLKQIEALSKANADLEAKLVEARETEQQLRGEIDSGEVSRKKLEAKLVAALAKSAELEAEVREAVEAKGNADGVLAEVRRQLVDAHGAGERMGERVLMLERELAAEVAKRKQMEEDSPILKAILANQKALMKVPKPAKAKRGGRVGGRKSS